LIRSLDGGLSTTIRRITGPYVSRFNRRRSRDGPLLRGRFRSIPVESTYYFQTLVRYIDQNPVEAGLAHSAEGFEYGSARWHSAGGERPRWLSRDLVDALVVPWTRQGLPRAEAYARAFPSRLPCAQRRFVDARLGHACRDQDALDGLLSATDTGILEWMNRRASLADNTKPGLPMIDGHTLVYEMREVRSKRAALVVPAGPRRSRDAWDLIEVALLHDLAGETHSEIARRRGLHGSFSYRLYEEHRLALAGPAYASLIVEAAREVMALQHGQCSSADTAMRDLSRRLLPPVAEK
jgi:hypothetical protein